MSLDLLSTAIAWLVNFIPGIAASHALLYRMDFSRTDKILFGLCLGIVLVPALSFLEFVFLGLRFTAGLVLANVLLVLLASLAAYYAQAKKLPDLFKVPKIALPDKDTLIRWWPAAAMLILAVIAFWIRLTPAWSPTFFEFDPYYYIKLTENLVQDGFLPLFNPDSYFPEQQFQHWPPISQYLTGGWVLLHNLLSGQGYDKDTLILISQTYPPLVAALMVFLAFALVREKYNAELGVVAAGLVAFTPQLVKKLGAGVAEQQPWNFYATLLLFAVLLIALHRQSRRMGVFAAVAAMAVMFGSQQYIWAMSILALFLGIQGILDFLGRSYDARKWAILAMPTLAFFAGNTILAYYQNQQYVAYLSPQILLLAAAFVFNTALFAAGRWIKLDSFKSRLAILGGVLVAGLLVGVLTGLLSLGVNTLIGQAQIAGRGTGITQTVAEEGATPAGIFPSAFGALNPLTLLLLAGLVTWVLALVILLRHKHVKWGIGLGAFGMVSLFMQGLVGGWLKSAFGSSDNAVVQAAIQILTQTEVFGYMSVALVSVCAAYLASTPHERSLMGLFLVLIVFPIAFVGLNKVKYIVHLGFALTLLLPYLLGETMQMLEKLNEWFNVFSNRASFRTGALAIVFFVGILVVFNQAGTVPQSMTELQYTRMPQDWVDTFKWMRTNLPTDARVMSWWDYGHWTTFFGERNTVLNPSNLFADFDHGVARAFVHQDPNGIFRRMYFHNATHLMLDAELIQKWGALVYLSGTCSRQNADICPNASELDPRSAPGQSTYEAEHYFEYLAVAGNCPAAAIGVPLPMVQSALGARYCLTEDQMIYLDGKGQLTNVTRPYKLAGRDAITEIREDTAYLFASGQNQFINVNPYYEPFGLHNYVSQSVFTRLFFFESFPGFKTVYRSPNSYVKIFEFTGLPNAPAATPTPAASPTPEPETTPPDSNTTANGTPTVLPQDNTTASNASRNASG